MERDAPSPKPMVYSFIYICQSPQLRSSPKKWGKNIWSLSTEAHMYGSPTYNGVWPGSPKGSFMTLLSLPQCHAAFSMTPSTLSWVDQSPVNQRVVVTLNRVSPAHTLPPPWPRVRIHITLRYRRGVGPVGGIRTNTMIHVSSHWNLCILYPVPTKLNTVHHKLFS